MMQDRRMVDHIRPCYLPSMLMILGTASSFRTDSAISGTKVAGERTLQRWVADVPEDLDGSLEGPGSKSSAPWDQFAENSRRFGLTTDYDENIYTTKIDKNHPQYKQRLADAEKKAREIERSMASNPHVAEERITDHVSTEDNRLDEEDKYVTNIPAHCPTDTASDIVVFGDRTFLL